MLSRRVPRAARANAWSRALAARRAGGGPLLDLTDANPTRTGLSPLAEAAAILARVPAAPYAPDPRGLEAARVAIADALGARGARPDPGQLVLAASTSEACAQLLRLLCEPGEAVLVPRPGYPLFEPLARAEGVRVRPYRLEFDGRWRLDRASFAAAAAGAKAAFLVEPGNPTGSCLDADERAFVEETAARHGLALIADEVFGDAPWPRGGPDPPLPTWRGDRAVPTFVLGGLSKRCGLPHLKLAWIAALGPPRARGPSLEALAWLADLFLSVGAPVQAAAPELLALHAAFTARLRARLAENLAALRALVARRPELALLPADGGWSAMLRVPATRTDEAWALALAHRGVVVHPGHFYDVERGEHLVVSLIVEPRVFASGLAALADVAAG